MAATLPTLKTRREIVRVLDELQVEWSVAMCHANREHAQEIVDELMELGDDASRARFTDLVISIDNLVGRFETRLARM